MQQVALADDADHPIVGIDDGNPADPALREERRQRLHRGIRINRDDLGRHHIHRAHRHPSLADRYEPQITMATRRSAKSAANRAAEVGHGIE